MNSQELRALQEAYIEVVMNEDKVGIDDKLSSGKTPRQKMKTKASNLDMDANIAGGVASSPSWRTSKSIRLGAKEQESSLKKRAKKIREVETNQQEQTDLYDIILSHLLDEGYAETLEQAQVIMVNMSEDWRESIMEGMKPLPVGKMAKQAERKAFYHNIDYEPWSYYTNTNRQLRKMSEVGGKKVKKAAEKGRELANDVDNRLYRKYAPPDLHR